MIAIGRKNNLFAGSDAGGHRAAAIYSLIETAKLNGIDPQHYLTDVLSQDRRIRPSRQIDRSAPLELEARADLTAAAA